MTKTWVEMRRQLSRDLREPVFRRVGGEISIGGSTAIENFYSTALGKIATTFGVPYGFAYCHYTTDGAAPVGQELEITNFQSNGAVGYAYVSPSPTAAFGANDKVEIHELWSVAEKQDAINRAIDDAWPAFYQEVINESIIIQKFKREYDLSALTVRPRHLVGAYIEPLFRVGQGIAVAPIANYSDLIDSVTPIGSNHYIVALIGGNPPNPIDNTILINETTGVACNILTNNGNATVTVESRVSPGSAGNGVNIISGPRFTNLSESGHLADFRYNIVCPGLNFQAQEGRSYEAVVFYGPAAGSAAAVDTAYETSDGVYLDSALSATLTDISEFMIKNMTDVYYNWLGPLTRIRLDQDENPTTIEILYDTYEIWGARLRLVYAANLNHMLNESSSIDDAPAGYVIPRAKYHLYLGRIGTGPQFEVKTAATMADSFDREADKYRDRNRMKRLSSTIKTDQGYINWSDREMPFRR